MRKQFNLSLPGGKLLELGRRTAVVGVLNVTPDSFSDGGRSLDRARAIDRAIEMEAEGADVIEIGGESTRPGSESVSVEAELTRLMPVLQGLSGRLRVPISIDTRKSEVARAALDLGAALINDVSALRFDPDLAGVVSGAGAGLVLMHMRGAPATMQRTPPSEDVFPEIISDLRTAIAAAATGGIPSESLIVDPGLGFGKSLEQNLEILNHLNRLESLGLPIMAGPSRKSFIGKLTGRGVTERVFGTAASVAAAIIRGAHLVRVHDVKEMVDVARVTDAVADAATQNRT